MLLAWLFNFIEPNLRSSISYFDMVKESWDDLRQLSSIGNGSRIQQLTSDLARCEQNGQSISIYYERDERQVHQFLMELDDDLYGNIRTNIIAQDSLPPLNRAYALVIQEERYKNMTKGKEGRSEAISFVTPTGGLGHMEKNSYRHSCGAASSSGRGKGVNFGVANAAQNAMSNQSNTIIHLSSQDRGSLTPALSDEQWNTMINMFKSLAPNNDNQAEKLYGMSLFLWILDIGASLHMIDDKSVLHNLHDIFPIHVCLPDESKTPTRDPTLPHSRVIDSDSLPNTYAGEDVSDQGDANISNFDTPTSSSISPSSDNDNIASSDDSDERRSDIVNDTNDVGYATNESQENTGGPCRSSHERQPSVLFRDFVCHTFQSSDLIQSYAPPNDLSSSGTMYPLANFVTYSKFSTAHTQFLVAVTMGNEPIRFS
ncbi:hypothetical protein Tco_0214406 [Tanacetum coccineum]